MMTEKRSNARQDNLMAFAESCAQYLVQLNERVVFAESCTGGMLSSTMAGIPGISNYLCGSFVTYRPNSKRRWLGVNKTTIAQKSTESIEVAQEMAIGALKNTPEANWAMSIVGHLGPDAPSDKDGMVWICIARHTKKGKFKIKHISNHHLSCSDRISRQYSAAETAFTLLSRCLLDKAQKNESRPSLKTA